MPKCLLSASSPTTRQRSSPIASECPRAGPSHRCLASSGPTTQTGRAATSSASVSARPRARRMWNTRSNAASAATRSVRVRFPPSLTTSRVPGVDISDAAERCGTPRTSSSRSRSVNGRGLVALPSSRSGTFGASSTMRAAPSSSMPRVSVRRPLPASDVISTIASVPSVMLVTVSAERPLRAESARHATPRCVRHIRSSFRFSSRSAGR